MDDSTALDRARAAADRLLRAHLGGAAWSFDFDRATRRAGLCDFRARRITLSRHFAARATEHEVRQVLLHEIAHALAGPHAGHGARWRALARELGYTGGRTHQQDFAADLAPWIGRCPAGHEHRRFRRPARRLSCGRCARGYSEAHAITWHPRSTV